MENTDFTVLYFSRENGKSNVSMSSPGVEVCMVERELTQLEYVNLLHKISSERLIFVDGDRVTLDAAKGFVLQSKTHFDMNKVGYVTMEPPRVLWRGIRNLWRTDREIVDAPILIGSKDSFLKAYGGKDLANNTMAGVGYSLQKIGGIKFYSIQSKCAKQSEIQYQWDWWLNYSLRIPLRYLGNGRFFSELFSSKSKVQRDLVYRLLFSLFACFAFIFMPYISQDFGVTGDEFVDHRHAGYVLDYFEKGDQRALHQPQTALHLYGNSVQVITAAICRWFEVDHYYELRHFVGGIIGAIGVLVVGWMGLRWGGGLCGLLCLLFMFFTPRFFGHSMNNLKDVPFAVGYMLALFYTIRLFDYYPYFRLRHVLGLILGIALALGTRSGGLVLYPMLFMYAGLFYIAHCGIRHFYRFGKYYDQVLRIFSVLFVVIVGSYLLAISLWPFALANPISGVFYSLSKFTNYSIGLRTTFDGEQMMSNMLPWRYAPQYLCIGMPIVILIGFFLYGIYSIIRKKEFSLISFFLLFAAIFPVYWVIHCNSNLYGGIRHLLFVMPPMVVLAGRFWSQIILDSQKYVKLGITILVLFLLALPISHTLRNHPNEYIYFNEFIGGLKNAYGDYETDYYFNSLKNSTDWFRENILPDLPKDKKTIVTTQAAEILQYYFRHDTNIKIRYSRYYGKYANDWDYAIFGNVYISPYQLKNQLFPPAGSSFVSEVDGFPMSFVLKRMSKKDLQGFHYEKEQKYDEAIQAFNAYLKENRMNEEVWSCLGKLYYLKRDFPKAQEALENALKLQPSYNEALYISILICMETGEDALAFQRIDQMLKDNSSSADAWYLKALLYYNLKDYQTAINTLNHLLSLRPDYAQAHQLAGHIFRDHGDYAQAAKMYEQAVRFRVDATSVILLAEMWVRLKMYQQAETLLKQVKQHQPSYYPIHKVECRMFLQKGQFEEAKGALEQMKHITDDPDVFVLWAIYTDMHQDTIKCQQMLEQALSLDPKHSEALQMKERLR